MTRGAAASRQQKGGTNPRLKTWAGTRLLTGCREDERRELSEGAAETLKTTNSPSASEIQELFGNKTQSCCVSESSATRRRTREEEEEGMFFFWWKKKEGRRRKKERKKERKKKKENVVPTYHPPGPGWDVVAELPFDGAFRGFPCHYAVSKLHLMRERSPEIRHLIEKTFALACWATCSLLHTIWNHG